MEYIGLQHFTLESFDEEDANHKRVARLLHDDDDTYNYFGDIYYYIENRKIIISDKLYVAFYDGVAIGVIALLILHDNYYIACGILPEMRGINLSSKLLSEYCDYLFWKNPDLDNIYVQINPNNIQSIKNALKAGFEKEKDHNIRYVLRRK